MHIASRCPFYRVLPSGHVLAYVPLATGEAVVLDAGDLARLESLGISRNWHLAPTGLGYSYVRTAVDGQSRPVARLILDVPSGFRVRYRNGPLDLRRAALWIEERRKTRKPTHP